MGDAVLLDDLNGGRLMVFKIHIPVSVGIEGDKLAGRIQKIRGRHRFFDHLIDAGQEIGDGGGAVRPGGHFGNGMSVCPFYQKYSALDRCAVVCVMLPNGEVWPFIVLQADGGVLAGEQLHMVLGGVQQVVRHRGGFL